MAKTNWKKLVQEFQRAHAKNGIKLQDWCTQNGISYASARRYIKVRKGAQNNEKSAQKKSAKMRKKSSL